LGIRLPAKGVSRSKRCTGRTEADRKDYRRAVVIDTGPKNTTKEGALRSE
jgi:hypothetical protein